MWNGEKSALIAREFAHLEKVIYLNTGLTSVPPLRVQNAYADEMRRFVDSCGSEKLWDDEAARTRAALARLVGAQTDEIALSNNTTAGIDVISMGYPWQADKNIVLYAREHPSNLINWLLREREGKLKIKLAKPSPGGLRADDVIDAMDRDTQAVAVSWVQYSDGGRVDLARIGKACRDRGIPLIVDAIQGMGRLAIDVNEYGIDFLACGGHKGLMARVGVGFMFCSRRLNDMLRPFNGSHQSIAQPVDAEEYLAGGELKWCGGAERFENGCHNHAGVVALASSLSLIEELGIENIERHIVGLQTLLYEQLGECASAVRPKGDLPSGILTVPFAAEKRGKIKEIAAKHRVIGTLRNDNLRLCISFFNTAEQMCAAALAIKEMLGA